MNAARPHFPLLGAGFGLLATTWAWPSPWRWLLLTLLLYALASLARRSEPLWRGALVGLSAGLNSAWLTLWLGWPVGLALGALNLAAASPLTRSPRFRQWLGWGGWLLPLAWPATVLGAGAFALHLLVPCSVRRVTLNRATGSIVLVGGWLWWPGFRGGYSLGQFAFLTPDALDLLAHETGHTLNNAAFGSLFHFVGAADELLLPLVFPARRWADAYAERVAESHNAHSAERRLVQLWQA